MAHRPHNNTPVPYSVRQKRSAGKEFTQIYVPSRIVGGVQQYAWIELVDPPTGDRELRLSADEVLDLLYDPGYVAEWKVAYLQQAYQDFRAMKNARERGDISYSDWQVEIHDGPQHTTISLSHEQINSQLVVDSWLAHLPEKQARFIRLHVFDGLSFVEIARLEHPDAGDAEIATKANSIGRSVKRGLKKLAAVVELECPERVRVTGV